MSAALPFVERRYRSHDGLDLYYRDFTPAAGAARAALPVLCVPGLTRNSRDFLALATRLQARGRRVLCVDLRGRGHSQYDPEWRNYHPGTYLADLHALLADAGTANAVFVGTSLGGLLTMLAALTRPGLVAAAVINDIGPVVDPAGVERIRGYVGRREPVATWDEAVLSARAMYSQALPGLDEAAWRAYARQLFRERADGRVAPDYDPGIGEAARAGPVAQADLWPAFRALLPLPTLVLRGANSDILSAATLAQMQREKPDLQAVTVAHRGHAPLLDEPDALAALDAFFASAP